jgi:hypothetical protein
LECNLDSETPGRALPVDDVNPLLAQAQRAYAVFAVTPAGVIATDPLNADAARWLRAEITQRFNQPVRV